MQQCRLVSVLPGRPGKETARQLTTGWLNPSLPRDRCKGRQEGPQWATERSLDWTVPTREDCYLEHPAKAESESNQSHKVMEANIHMLAWSQNMGTGDLPVKF